MECKAQNNKVTRDAENLKEFLNQVRNIGSEVSQEQISLDKRPKISFKGVFKDDKRNRAMEKGGELTQKRQTDKKEMTKLIGSKIELSLGKKAS